MLSEFLMSHYQGDKLNIAAIGNICSQLHVHHVVRFKTDKCWPQPIWGKYQPIAYTTEQLAEINATIGKSLQQIVKELPSQ
jgi:diadenosine tetraphosphate (Ap4A) HIT family hydrolase